MKITEACTTSISNGLNAINHQCQKAKTAVKPYAIKAYHIIDKYNPEIGVANVALATAAIHAIPNTVAFVIAKQLFAANLIMESMSSSRNHHQAIRLGFIACAGFVTGQNILFMTHFK